MSEHETVSDDFGTSFFWQGPQGWRHARYDDGTDHVAIYGGSPDGQVPIATVPIVPQHLDPVQDAERIVVAFLASEAGERES
ncbi:MAG TPA: hypothetical protein VKD26_14225 [Streptosporangiaceae bacterium]|nr:hypothetical protein [Streptosporangiaceae bacterium]